MSKLEESKQSNEVLLNLSGREYGQSQSNEFDGPQVSRHIAIKSNLTIREVSPAIGILPDINVTGSIQMRNDSIESKNSENSINVKVKMNKTSIINALSLT